jgi:tRNA threonylcarbamoyladenosine biosynthesis protein TsaE
MISNDSNKTICLELVNEKASEDFARLLASLLKPALILGFTGEIGTGKTTLIRAMLKQLGIKSAIKSPTFSLVESYTCDTMLIHHFDLYRIAHEDELDYLGFRDYFTKNSVSCIEWAEHAGNTLPKIDIQFNLSIKGAGREVLICALSAAGERILACLAGES